MEENLEFTIEDITIEDMIQNIFKTLSVKKKRRDIVAYYSAQLQLGLFEEDNADGQATLQDVEKRVDEVLKEDKNSSDPYLSYSKQYYSKKKNKKSSIAPTGASVALADTNYVGKAGECAVMSELLFRGYNVNNMMVDEGIDLVASKNNVFYYIQVKTAHLTAQNKFYFKIKQDRFSTFIGTQIRYILVARCLVNKEEKNIFFMFTNNDIQRLVFQGNIPQPANNILSIKIDYDTRTNKYFMYDGKNVSDISFNMNNFDL